MTPRATYRLLLNSGFTFHDAERIVPYLADLGVSHVATSPITVAAPGSTNGQDVVDPTRISAELGGEAGLRALVAALKAREMGLLVDLVPDHLAITGDINPWWLDVLAHGQASRHARMFDIDWRAPVMLPVLGAPFANVVAAGDLRLVECGERLGLQLYGAAVYPLRADDPVLAAPRAAVLARHDPGTAEGRAALESLAARQHYRFAVPRAANDALNWRRFRENNDRAALRVEDPEVFELTHRLHLDLFAEGLIDGVRVEHADALTDPVRYCRQLRTALTAAGGGRAPYIIVAKLLAPDERLAEDWHADGTDGHDFMRQVSALIHAPEGEEPLRDLWHAISGRTRNYPEEAYAARREALMWQFEGELLGCVDAFSALADATGREWITKGMLRRAIEQLIWVLPVHRTYGDGRYAPPEDAAVRGTALAAARRQPPYGHKPFAGMVLDWLAGANGGEPALAAEAVRRFQQLAATVAATAIEGTAAYRHGALLSWTDAGFDPSLPSWTIEDFHAAMSDRLARLPHGLLAIATCDHKRGADARARLAVLTAIADEWRARVGHWLELAAPYAAGVHPADQYLAYQALVSAWEQPVVDLLPRLRRRQVSALRDARLRSSWFEPDEAYERRCGLALEALLRGADGGAFVADVADFVARIKPAAVANGLAQTVLHLTAPGVPEILQGAELLDYRLARGDDPVPVPVPVARGRELLAESAQSDPDARKVRLIAGLLALRRDRPRLFAEGDYQPCRVVGPRARHVLAFTREDADGSLFVAVALGLGQRLVERGAAYPAADWWGHTRVDLGESARAASDLFKHGPIHVESCLNAAGTPATHIG